VLWVPLSTPMKQTSRMLLSWFTPVA
jgi:hypothetical protein